MRTDLAGGSAFGTSGCQECPDGAYDGSALAVSTHPPLDGLDAGDVEPGVVALEQVVARISVLKRLGELRADVCQHGGEALDLTVSTGSFFEETG